MRKMAVEYSKELDDLTAIKKVSNNIKFKDLTKQEQEEVLQDLVKNIKFIFENAFSGCSNDKMDWTGRNLSFSKRTKK